MANKFSKLFSLEHQHSMNCMKLLKFYLGDNTSHISVEQLENENKKIDEEIKVLQKELGIKAINNIDDNKFLKIL